MVRSVRIEHVGGSDVMALVDIDLGVLASGSVRVRHCAIGVNYIDIYHRTGLYPVSLPSGLGLEACGVIEEMGSDVDSALGLEVGDRVGYATGPIGAYSEVWDIPAGRVIKIPDSLSDEIAAGLLLKGMTARYLLRETYGVRSGETILFHAAAGGVGQIACQWARSLGVRVIGTAGGEEKVARALSHGCDAVIDYLREDIASRVRELTDGAGVAVVYDSVGKSTFEASLKSLRPRGLLVSYGNASGPVENVDLGVLASHGSLYVTRPSLMHYVARDSDLQANAGEVLDMVTSGRVRVHIGQRYGLSEVRLAHEDLENRRTYGSSILLPPN